MKKNLSDLLNDEQRHLCGNEANKLYSASVIDKLFDELIMRADIVATESFFIRLQIRATLYEND